MSPRDSQRDPSSNAKRAKCLRLWTTSNGVTMFSSAMR